MRRKFAGIVFVCFGAVLILSALLLFLYTSVTDSIMAQENRKVYEELVQIAAQRQTENAAEENTAPTVQEDPVVPAPPMSQETVTTAPEESLSTEHTPMESVRIGSFDYVGFLDIPALTLSLPVLEESDEESLKAAPCRQFGTPETDDFVIAGHNYRRHFADLYKLKSGDAVQFTDMDGDTVIYQVAIVTVVDAVDVAAILESTYELILYTCDYTGNNRIAVFCSRANS